MGDAIFSCVQIGAKNYLALSDFYCKALNFTLSNDIRWLNGKEGCVLTAPGYPNGKAPVFAFVLANEGACAQINDIGYAHTCFETTDMKATIKRFIKLGGKIISSFSNPDRQPCVYCADPEGNVVEFHVPFTDGIGYRALGRTLRSILGLLPDKCIRKSDNNLPCSIKFIHVNIISDDWRNLCNFYIKTLGSIEFGPLKDHEGKFKSKVIGIPNVHVVGRHVLLPGLEKTYPTIEIFTYSVKGRKIPADDDSLGINCMGLISDDPATVAEKFKNAGGNIIEKSDDRILICDCQGDLVTILKD